MELKFSKKTLKKSLSVFLVLIILVSCVSQGFSCFATKLQTRYYVTNGNYVTDGNYNNFSIQEPSKTIIRNKDAIILHISARSHLPKGSFIVWSYKTNKFDVEEANNGMKVIATAEKNGWTVFTATLYDINGRVIGSDSVELYSKSGFFDKIGGFFRSMFGATRIYDK